MFDKSVRNVQPSQLVHVSDYVLAIEVRCKIIWMQC